MMKKNIALSIAWIAGCVAGAAGTPVYSLTQQHDSLSILTLTTDSMQSHWRLPYPVYRFCTGDVDGDGTEDALVGVVKATRFSHQTSRRIFIFKNYHGKVRPLWMGSRLGGPIADFRFDTPLLTCLQLTDDGRFVVAQYQWDHFGMSFVRFLGRNITEEEARSLFSNL